MSRLILQMQSSIDGYVSSSVPEARWQLWDWGPEWPWSIDLRASFNKTFDEAAAILLSPLMLEQGYRDHWTRLAHAHRTERDWRFATRITELPIYVPSRGARHIPATAHLHPVPGPLERSVATVLSEVDGPLLCFGGAGLGRSLIHADLVDELQLFINPGIAGDGERIFSPALTDRRLTAYAADAYDCGVIVARWGPAGSRQKAPSHHRQPSSAHDM